MSNDRSYILVSIPTDGTFKEVNELVEFNPDLMLELMRYASIGLNSDTSLDLDGDKYIDLSNLSTEIELGIKNDK